MRASQDRLGGANLTYVAVQLFPGDLTRKQYGLRAIGLFAFFMVGVWLWVAALITAPVFIGWAVLGWVYGAVGLAVPRLRNAGYSPWFALFCLIPKVNLVVFFVLLILREQARKVPTDADRSLM